MLFKRNAFFGCSGIKYIMFPSCLQSKFDYIIHNMIKLPFTIKDCEKKYVKIPKPDADKIMGFLLNINRKKELPFEMIDYILKFYNFNELDLFVKK